MLLNQHNMGMYNNTISFSTRSHSYHYSVFDKPADRRLAPWITLGSILLGVFGAAEIVFTFVKQGTFSSLWGLFISGIILAAIAVLGVLAGTTRRSQLAGLVCTLFILALSLQLVFHFTKFCYI